MSERCVCNGLAVVREDDGWYVDLGSEMAGPFDAKLEAWRYLEMLLHGQALAEREFEDFVSRLCRAWF